MDSLLDESTSFLYKRRLDQKLAEEEYNSLQDEYQYLINSMHQAAKEALGELKLKNTRNNLYWSEELEQLRIDKKCKYQNWLSTKRIEDKIKYKEAQAKMRKAIVKRKNETREHNCGRVESFIGGKQNTEAWHILKNLRRNTKEHININYITLDKWENYFKSLLSEQRQEYLNPLEEETDPDSESHIELNLGVVTEAIKKLKNGRSSGPEGIPAELIKHGSNKLHERLRRLMERCLNGEEIPEDWKLGYISVIHKKGKKDDCSNYRGITVTSTMSRLYGRIIKHFLEENYKHLEIEEQAGFRTGRSTIDNIFCLTQMIEKTVQYRNSLHLTFIDLEKAYDNIPISKIWTTLRNMEINCKIIKAMKIYIRIIFER